MLFQGLPFPVVCYVFACKWYVKAKILKFPPKGVSLICSWLYFINIQRKFQVRQSYKNVCMLCVLILVLSRNESADTEEW